MNKLNSFLSVNIDGGERISYTYDVLDNTGEVKQRNQKKSFFAVDPELVKHIEYIKDYIRHNKLNK